MVPLSEDEQRILSEIEAQLYESDPGLAKEVGSTTVYTHAFRNLKWAALGFVIGVVVMVLTLSMTFWLSFVGFLIMLGSALFFERNARRLGKVGLQQMTQNMRSGGLRDYFGNTTERMRSRLRRSEEGDETT